MIEKNPDAKLLRIFVGESDKHGAIPLYESIIFEAKKYGLAGATAMRAVMGFGANSIIHTAKLLEISSDLPVVIEIVDVEEKVRKFVEHVEELFEQAKAGGLITIEKAEVIRYKPGQRA